MASAAKVRSRSSKKASTRRAIQLSLDGPSQIYYKVIAEFLGTDVSKLVRAIVNPYAINDCVKQILSELDLIDLDMLEAFTCEEEEILKTIADLPQKQKSGFLKRIIEFGLENDPDHPLDYRYVSQQARTA